MPVLYRDAGVLSLPAIAITNKTAGGTTSSATSATTASVSINAGDLVLLSVSTYKSSAGNPATPAISGTLGLTWDLIKKSDYDTTTGDTSTLFTFRALAPSAVSGTIIIDFSGVSISRIAWVVDQVSGADTGGSNGSHAIVQSVATGEGAGSGQLFVATTLAAFSNANNFSYYAAGVQGQGTLTFTPTTGYTKTGEFNTSTNFADISNGYKQNDTAPRVDWTLGTSSFKQGMVALELKVGPATAGASLLALTGVG